VSTLDAGGPTACDDRDAKDLAPCIEDCNRGIGFACASVASRLEHGGEGVPRDLTRAVAMHERACELRDAPSCIAAARMHAAGSGVPPSRARQMDLLAAACHLGDAFACAAPAKAFAEGAGVPRDPRRAKELYERGCIGGVESACEAIEDAGP
jgi:TPR repeat protein